LYAFYAAIGLTIARWWCSARWSSSCWWLGSRRRFGGPRSSRR